MNNLSIDLGDSPWQLKGYWCCEWEMSGGEGFPPPARGVTPWLEAEVPGSIPRTLLQNGVIDDPYPGMNSLNCEWTWQRDWVYRCCFHLDESMKRRAARLRFEGVDYACVVGLNGRRLGEHEGMFSPFEFDVSSTLRWGTENELWVAVREAPHEVSQIGRSYDVRTVKTRMNYKWDFATRLVNLGIWNPVKLELFDRVRVEDLCIRSRLVRAEKEWSAQVEVSAELEVISSGGYELECEITGPRSGELGSKGSERWGEDLPEGRCTISREFQLHVTKDELWWPNTMGDRVLHEVKLRLLDGDEALTESRTHFGIRDVRFEAVPGGPPEAPAYSLAVNGRETQIQGFNWVPVDHMYGPEYRDRYDQLTDRFVEAGANLIRIWGGGLVEKDILYRLCDEKGILVWQDFIQSSSGVSNRPPREPEFLTRLESESLAAIRRLRNHPCLAVWCGGNELSDENQKPLTSAEPAIGLLEDLVKEYDPGRHFLATNPTGEVFSLTFDVVESGAELWDVHGPWQYAGDPVHYELFNRNTAIFQSEFGAVGTANVKTLRYVAPEEELWKPHLEHPLWLHHGAWWIHTPQVEGFFGPVEDLESYVESSQFLQAEAIRYAVESNRRRYPQCAGMIVWQFNEPWPTTACTNHVDWFGRPKMSYYFVKGAYQPLCLSLRYSSIRIGQKGPHQVDCFVSNLSDQPFEGPARIEALSPAAEVLAEKEPAEVWVPPGETRLLGTLGFSPSPDHPIVFCRITAGEKSGTGKTYVFSSEKQRPFAPLWSLPPARISASVEGDGRVAVENVGETVAFLVRVEAADSDLLLLPGDGFVTLLPGEKMFFQVRPTRVHGKPVSAKGVRVLAWGWNTNRAGVELQ